MTVAAAGLVVLMAFAGSSTEDLAAAARLEVVQLHRFIEQWSNGALENRDEVYARFAEALAEDFELVSPDGTVADRQAIVDGFRSAHGRWQDGDGVGRGRIRVEAIELRLLAPPLALLTYEEWHDLEGATRGRLSSVLLRQRADAPGGVEWVHLHETWLGVEAP